MVGNIHSLGMALQNAMRPEIAGHRIAFLMKTSGELPTQTEVIPASSPPIGHELETETGLDLSIQNRVFYIEQADLKSIGIDKPCIGHIVVDKCDESYWRVLPQDGEYGWRYHGQDRSAIQILTEQDCENA